MGLIDVFRRGKPSTALAESQRALQEIDVERGQLAESYELLTERLAELELQQEDLGWQRLSMEGHREFSRAGLQRIIDLARLTYLKNPLIRRGVDIQAFYVFALGLNIQAKDDQVNAVVQDFLDDAQNEVELTSQQARKLKEVELQVTGNLFFVWFSNVLTGRVRVRTIPVEDIQEIITNPQDKKEPWYFKRVWAEPLLDVESGVTTTVQRTAYYPDWRYQPAPGARLERIGQGPVMWDNPIYHVKTGGFADWTFGCPEVYPALDWARAVKEDLEDYATVKKALARFAWALTTKGGAKGVAAAKTRLSTTLATGGQVGFDTNPPPLMGSTFVAAEGVDMAPIKTAGAQTHPDEGRRLWLMVGAALGLPETMLTGDAHAGNRATAFALDRPTELKFKDRQTMWADIHQAILTYVVDQSALATRGKLKGTRQPADEADPLGASIVVLGEDPATGDQVDRHIEVDFPDMLERDVTERVKAIVDAATLGGFPSLGTLDPRTLARLLLQALGEDDLDELLDKIAPEDGPSLMDQQRAEQQALPARQQAGKPAIDQPSAPVAEALVEAIRELQAARRTGFTVSKQIVRDAQRQTLELVEHHTLIPALSGAPHEET